MTVVRKRILSFILALTFSVSSFGVNVQAAESINIESEEFSNDTEEISEDEVTNEEETVEESENPDSIEKAESSESLDDTNVGEFEEPSEES